MATLELQSPESSDTVLSATAIRRKRGPSLSRRIGQSGNVFQHGHNAQWIPTAPAYGRYYIDLPGVAERKRRTVTLGVCPTRTVARRKLREHIDTEGINSKEAFTTATAPAMTFRVQAERWIAALPTRRRRPVKPATICGWRHALDKWILPRFGDRLLSEIANGAMRELIESMAAVGLAAKTIVNYSQVVKMVLASAVNEDGDQLYPRKWNHDFIGLPIIEKEKQHRPTVTAAEIEEILVSVKHRYGIIFALLAGTGLRFGEVLALKPESFSPDCRMLQVKRSIWHGKEQAPKTGNAVREIDLPDSLAALMRDYVKGKTGYLFCTASGRPLGPRNVLRALHATGKKIGFHAFRRFRTETLRRMRVPEDLIGLWLGHARRTVTDLYATGLQQDQAWRREWCERAGFGFSLSGLNGLQNGAQVSVQKVA